MIDASGVALLVDEAGRTRGGGGRGGLIPKTCVQGRMLKGIVLAILGATNQGDG